VTVLIERLAPGPVDVIGDVHGEIEALDALLVRLGYGADGSHPDGRRLAFVGDLIDRGPDSPAVLRRVKALVDAGVAQAVLGNHDMNALRNNPHVRRSGEGWWYGRRDHYHRDSLLVDEEEKREVFLPFLRSLPLALERKDLRVVHACWHPDSVATVKASGYADAEGLFADVDARNGPMLEALKAASEAAKRPYDMHRESTPVPYLKDVARYNEVKVMHHPVRVLTGGMERDHKTAFYASGKWRFAERVPWWNDYAGPPVVVGHFWRRREGGGPKLFGGAGASDWLGPSRSVTCVDYSVGLRFKDRRAGRTDYTTHLAALRVPQWRLVFEDGVELQMSAPGPPGLGDSALRP